MNYAMNTHFIKNICVDYSDSGEVNGQIASRLTAKPGLTDCVSSPH